MSKLLGGDAVERYQSEGFCFPVPVLSREEAAGYRRCLEQHEASTGKPLQGNWRHKTHLLFTWADRLVHHPKILDAVEDLIGPDILCWTTNFFIKEASHPGFVSWHQDATYWGLSSPDVVTAWVALTPSTVESGCMKVVPGTHLKQLEHKDSFHEKNLLTRGQEVAAEVNEADAVNVVLQPGELSLHHVLLVHGSEPNRAALPRIGYAIRYIPPHLHQITGERDCATLVRGRDRFNHFDHEEPPKADMDAAAVEQHAAVIDAKTRILYRGARKPARSAS